MSVTVTRTKIQIPRRRDDLLSRNRLNQALDDLLDYPLTLISAPAGYGKTSLMIDLAHQAEFPVCWYTIDALDRDPQRFLTHLIHSIRNQYPDSGKNFLSLLDNLPDLSRNRDQLVATLVNDLILDIEEHFAIFLDDFHLLENQPVIESFISRVVQQMDDNAHLVIASRTQFSFPDLPLMIGRNQVKGIDFSDLAFRPEEIRVYLENKLDQPISAEESKTLEASTEGWITGLLLIAYQRGSGLSLPVKALRVTGANIADYFASQVFEKHPAWLQSQILGTSLLDEFNSEVCSKIFGEPEKTSWTEFIEILLEYNLFVELIEDNGLWLRYHKLFRDFLQARLASDQDECQRLTRLVYEYHLDQQNWDLAFAAAQQLQDPLAMAAVIEQASSPLFHAGRVNLLADWLDILPEEGFKEYPILLILRAALTSTLINPHLGLELLFEVENTEEIQNDPDLYRKYLVCRATTYRLLGEYKKAFHDIQEILNKQINQNEKFSILSEAYRESGLILNHLGDFPAAIKSFENSLYLYEQKQDFTNAALVHLDMGLVQMDHGNFIDAKNQFQSALKTWTEHNNYPNLSIAYNNLGALSIFTGDFIESKEYLILALSYAETTASHRMQAFINASFGDLTICLDKPDTSIVYYEKALDHAVNVHEKYLINYININLSKCFRLLGNFKQAGNILQVSKTTENQTFPENLTGHWHLEKGFLFLGTGQFKNAFHHFEISHKLFQDIHKPNEFAISCFGLALISLASDQIDQLEDHLREFFSVLQRTESVQPLLPTISRYASELSSAAAKLPAMGELTSLQDQITDFLDSLPELRRKILPLEDNSPGTGLLRIRAFGRIQVERGGRRITASEWIHQRTARELFFYLLTQTHGISKEQVGLIFWPDSSLAQLSCQFKNAIYRLRRALGKETILYDPVTHTYQFNRDINYKYDVEEFTRLCQQAADEDQQDRAITLYRQAAALYQHPFAPQLDGVWTEPLRRSLYLEYEKAQLVVAKYCLKKKQYRDCITTCNEIINIEPCHEGTYQLSMLSYAGLGDKTGIRRVFDKCNRKFSTILGIKPTQDTIKLFNQLL